MSPCSHCIIQGVSDRPTAFRTSSRSTRDDMRFVTVECERKGHIVGTSTVFPDPSPVMS